MKMLNEYINHSKSKLLILPYFENEQIYIGISDINLLQQLYYTDTSSDGTTSIRCIRTERHEQIIRDNSIRGDLLCSESELEYLFSHRFTLYNRGYNRGEIFEKLIYQHYNQVWRKDDKPFTKYGDIQIDNIDYQIKYKRATVTTYKTMNRLIGYIE